jgi:hypothetical protein
MLSTETIMSVVALFGVLAIPVAPNVTPPIVWISFP